MTENWKRKKSCSNSSPTFVGMVSIRYLLAFILLTIGFSASARFGHYDDEPKPFYGGLAAGINLSQIDGDRYFGYHKQGITIGAVVQARLSAKWYAGMEILFSQKGSRGTAIMETINGPVPIANCYIGLSYVELPVTIQYKYMRFTLEAGASYARLVRTKEWIIEAQELYLDKEATRFNNTDINYLFGLSYRMHKRMYANARYQYSVFPIRPNDRIPAGYGYGTKGQFNNMFCIRLMYLL